MSEIPVFRFAIRPDITNPQIFLPKKGTEKSTGFDVKVATRNQEKLIIRPGTHVKIPLGFRVFAPEGWWLELRPRSSTFAKKQLHALYGVIDEDYEGEFLFACQYQPDIKSLGNDLVLEYGDAIGQIIPFRRQEMIVEEITNEDYDNACKARAAYRGAGGFGSTDKR